MKLNITMPTINVRQQVADLAKQTRFAASVALNRAVKDVEQAVLAEFKRSIDRPTPWTMSGTFTKPSTKDNLVAKVGLKDDAYKGTPASRYLAPQIFGGTRRHKSMEKALQQAGLLPASHFAVPASGAVLDQYGNVPAAKIVQIMSQLKVQRGGGYDARMSNSAASKRNVKKQGVNYFVLKARIGRLPPGIYARAIAGKGKGSIKPIFVFVSAVNYAKRIAYFEQAQTLAQPQFETHFTRSLRDAIRTAK